MNLTRRGFFKVVTAAGASAAIGTSSARAASTIDPQETIGCLVDTTLCVGCRKCEQACNERNHLPKPRESFDEMTVLENERRMDETTYTVVNKYYPKHIGALTWRTRPSFVKFQCMHCNHPACVSACIVGALKKQPNGAVIYDCLEVHRLPLLHGRLPLPGAGLRVSQRPRPRRCANAPSASSETAEGQARRPASRSARRRRSPSADKTTCCGSRTGR